MLEKLINSIQSWFRRRVRANAKKRFRRYLSDLLKTVKEPMIVKIGANDGIAGDPVTKILMTRNNWKGLLIEPVPYIFARLKNNFNDPQRFILEQVAIGTSNGEASFYYADAKAVETIPDLPDWFDKTGSFNRSHVVKDFGEAIEPFVMETKVQVCRFSDVLDRNHISHVHLLQIDTEGYDYEILKTLDFDNHAPLSIYIEHQCLAAADKMEMRAFLSRHGYLVLDCGKDYFAINEAMDRGLRQTK